MIIVVEKPDTAKYFYSKKFRPKNCNYQKMENSTNLENLLQILVSAMKLTLEGQILKRVEFKREFKSPIH